MQSDDYKAVVDPLIIFLFSFLDLSLHTFANS